MSERRGRGRPTVHESMVKVVTRMDPAILAALDAWAAQRRWTRTMAINTLIERGIGWPADQLAMNSRPAGPESGRPGEDGNRLAAEP